MNILGNCTKKMLNAYASCNNFQRRLRTSAPGTEEISNGFLNYGGGELANNLTSLFNIILDWKLEKYHRK